MKAQTQNMTSGNAAKLIFFFALPLMLGNICQQLYTMVDTMIVGQVAGVEALAALGSVDFLMWIVTGISTGITQGFSILISQHYGAGNGVALRKVIAHSYRLTAITAILVFALSQLLASAALTGLHTPQNIIGMALLYLRIIFCGIPFTTAYNMFACELRAIGNSKAPLTAMLIASIINIVLDLLFVGLLGFGVGAAALATIISQFSSAFLCMLRLMRTKDVYQVQISQIRFHRGMLGQIIGIGLPSGMQNSIISFANIIVQTNINKFGVMAVAGCGVYSKIEGFAFLPITCFAMSLTTFIGQNLGAKQYDRAKKGAYFGITCSTLLAEVVGVIVFFAIPQLAAAFNNEAQVVEFATRQAHIEAFFYCFLAFSHCIAGIMRGAGKSAVPMFVMLVSWCIIRITYITVTVHFIPKIQVIFWAYPLTWSISSVIFLIYFLKANWLYSFEKK